MSCVFIVLSGLAAETLSCLYLGTLYLIDKRRYRGARHSKDLTRRMFRIAVPLALSSYIRSGLSTVKHLMIPIGLEKFGGDRKVALAQYGVIHGLVLPVIYFPSALIGAFSALVIPEIAGFHIKKDHAGLDNAIAKIFKATLLFSICVSGILLCYSGDLAAAIYKKESAGYFIRALAPLVVIMYFDEVVDGLLKGLDRQNGVVRINIIDTAMCIGLIYVLLPIFGAKGYIAVMFASELLNGGLSILQLFKASNFEIQFVEWIVKPAVAIAVACAVSRVIVTAWFGINIGIAVLVYLGLLRLCAKKT
jgi:stage V sporulation protein B